MRDLTTIVYAIYYASMTTAFPQGSFAGLPGSNNSQAGVPSLGKSPQNSGSLGAAWGETKQDAQPHPTASLVEVAAATQTPPAPPPQPPTGGGRLTSGLHGDADAAVEANAVKPEIMPAAQAAGQRGFTTRDSKESKASPKPEVYNIDDPGAKPTLTATIPGVPMAMVHSEAALDSAHTMQPGDSILTAGIDPFASGLLLGMSGVRPQSIPAKATPAIQGATFAAGGATYTASIDRDLNIVVGSSILKPGGAAATLRGGAAVVSVVPGGALVVDGGTLTMSALHPPVTGAVININGRLVTAAQKTGADGKLLVLGTATVTAGAPATTIDGQIVSLGSEGLHLGGVIAAISTMTPSEITSSTPAMTATRVSGFARFSGSASTRPSAAPMAMKSGAYVGRPSLIFAIIGPLIVALGCFFTGG